MRNRTYAYIGTRRGYDSNAEQVKLAMKFARFRPKPSQPDHKSTLRAIDQLLLRQLAKGQVAA